MTHKTYVIVLTLAFLALQSTSSANHTGSTANSTMIMANGTVTIPAGQYYIIPVKATNLTIVGYRVASSIPVYVLVMNQSQLADFNATQNILYSITMNFTSKTMNIFLENETRYIVIYSQFFDANASLYVGETSNFTRTNSTMYVGSYYKMRPFSVQDFPLHLETRGAPFNLTFGALSDQYVSYQITDMDTGQAVLQTLPITITNLNLSGPTPTFWYTLRLPPGNYTLTMSSPNPRPALVYYEYHIVPDYVDPFLLPDRELSGGEAPTGIASFGLSYKNGKAVPYQISTDQIIGYANITSMNANNTRTINTTALKKSPDLINQLSLQLNEHLVMIDKNGGQSTYWTQDVLIFFTNTTTAGGVIRIDNVWNQSGDCAKMGNKTILSSSNGAIEPFSEPRGCDKAFYAAYDRAASNYTLPLRVHLVMNATALPGKGAVVSFGVTEQNNSTVWFDNATLLDPNISEAYLYVSGNKYTPIGARNIFGLYYDSELVFGGPAGGQEADFANASGQLQMYYYNETTKSLVPFPSAYSFGADTAEAVAHLATGLSNGYVVLAAGTPAFDNLYNSPTESFFANAGDAVASPFNTTPPPSPSLTPISKSAVANQPSSPSNSPSYMLVTVGAAFTLAAIALLFMLRRIGQPRTKAQGPKGRHLKQIKLPK